MGDSTEKDWTREGTSAFSLILGFETKRGYSKPRPDKIMKKLFDELLEVKSKEHSGLGLLLWAKALQIWNYTSIVGQPARTILIRITENKGAQLTSRQDLRSVLISAREERNIIFTTHIICYIKLLLNEWNFYFNILLPVFNLNNGVGYVILG